MKRFPKVVSLRLTKEQFKQCIENGGVSDYVRFLIDCEMVKLKIANRDVNCSRQQCGY